MSRTNLDIVRDVIEAWERGDWETAFQNAAPDFTLDNSSTRGEWSGIHTGQSRVQRVLKDFGAQWDSVRMELDEWLETGNDVVTSQTGYFRGRDGIEVTTRTSAVWRFHEGALSSLLFFNERADALAAAGIGEPETG